MLVLYISSTEDTIIKQHLEDTDTAVTT